MRDFLNGILLFIESESLTDEEFDSITLTDQEYNLATYDALKAIIQDREGVSGQLKKLNAYFVSKGVNLTPTVVVATSQILIGGVLD